MPQGAVEKGTDVTEYRFGLKRLCAGLALAILTFLHGPASVKAADFGDQPPGAFDVPFIDEIRAGAYYTNPDQKERGAAVQFEAIFSQFISHDFGNTYINALLLPRVHVGGNINVTGDTSVAYAGLTWQLPVYGPLFLEGTFGGGVHNGKHDNAGPNRQALGCPLAFRESGSIGLAFKQFTVLGTVEHLSNAGLCSQNDGLTNFGVRVGYKF